MAELQHALPRMASILCSLDAACFPAPKAGAETAGMDYSDRLQLALSAANMSRKQLKEAVGVSVQAIGQVINRQSNGFAAANNSRVAKALGVSPDWLATGEGPMNPTASDVAHAMSYTAFEDAPVTREQLMTPETIPARFVFVLEDDAMGKHGRAGDQVVFDKDKPWRVGSGVLVRTGSGEVHVRRVAQGKAANHWLAVPVNPLYRTLDSEADQLQVLAVWRSNLDQGLEDA
jgi:SOS-response transcriptional repressor LexA